MDQPDHACAILRDHRGWLVLQLRPPWVRHAASQLTCFGGKREAGETSTACLDRELGEELGWQPQTIPSAGIDLWQGTWWIARFHAVELPPSARLRVESGSVAIHAPTTALPGLPLSPWHAAVLQAWILRQPRVDLPRVDCRRAESGIPRNPEAPP